MAHTKLQNTPKWAEITHFYYKIMWNHSLFFKTQLSLVKKMYYVTC